MRASAASALLLALLPALSSCGPANRAPAAAESLSCPGCNVILVSLDTMRADALHAYGNPRRTSPNIDRLAAKGAAFSNAFSQFPHTFPNHMSIFTGQNPWTHRVRLTFHDQLSTGTVTLPMVMKAGGYRTVWAAVTRDDTLSLDAGFGRGFDDFVPPTDTVFEWTQKALTWLSFHPHDRFFMFLHTYRVHDPYMPKDSSVARFIALDPGKRDMPTVKDAKIALKHEVAADPERFLPAPFLAAHPEIMKARTAFDREELLPPLLKKDMEIKGEVQRMVFSKWEEMFWARFNVRDPKDVAYARALYDAAAYEADQGIGELYAKLQELGLADNTLIVITSDHGEEFMEHGNTTHHEDYVELVHVPLIFIFPGKTLGLKRPEVVRSIDIMPTILDVVGLPVPDRVQGVSLKPLMERRPDARVPGISFSQHFTSYAVRDARYTYIYNVKAKCERGEDVAAGRCVPQEFYDRAADPGELRNIYSDSSEPARRYRELLLSELKADGEPINADWLTPFPEKAKQRLLKTGYW
jgi:arylsulfatase A-like enzyme